MTSEQTVASLLSVVGRLWAERADGSEAVAARTATASAGCAPPSLPTTATTHTTHPPRHGSSPVCLR